MLYGSLQGEVAHACHVFGGTGIAPAHITGSPFNVAGVTRISAGFYQVQMSGQPVPPGNTAAMAISDEGQPIDMQPSLDTDGKFKFVRAFSSGGAPRDTNFYLVIVRT